MESFLKKEFDDFVEKISSTPSFKEFSSLDTLDLEKIYVHAYQAYEKSQYKEAISAFRYLILQNPLENRYWFCLAASLQEEKNYPLALRAWAMTSLLDKKNPYPHFHAAECYFSLKNITEGLKALDVAEKLINKENNSLEEQITLLKTCWSR